MTSVEQTTKTKGFSTATLDELATETEEPGRSRIGLRQYFDLGAFGSNAYRGDKAGVEVIGEHDELGAGAGGHEELYVVVTGHATFTVDGEEIDAPAGALVFVRDPGLKRKAVATEAGTTVLVVGGKPGEAFRPSPWETMREMWPPYRAGDYEAAIEVLRATLEKHPGNTAVLFNLACCESLLGRKEEALDHLAGAVGDERMRELTRTDSDLDAIREDPRFAALVEPERSSAPGGESP
jgi:mannose-6-phosphate isomerase-like protein (cupin superfamily)